LKIALSVGAKKGKGLMRRLEVSPDPVVMLGAALQEAAKVADIDSLWKTERFLCAVTCAFILKIAQRALCFWVVKFT